MKWFSHLVCIGMLLMNYTIGAGTLPALKCQDTLYVTAAGGEPVHLKGVDINNNVWGFWDWPRSDSLQENNMFAMIPDTQLLTWFLDSADYRRLADLHINVARYEFAFEAFAEDNPDRDENLAGLREQMLRLEAIGAYTILCCTVHPGWHVPMDNDCERKKPGPQRIPSVFESDSVYAHWEAMWVYMANGVKDLDCCAGFELLNEPRLPVAAECTPEEVTSKYVSLCNSIRSVDDRHIIFIPEFNSREAEPGETYDIEVDGTSITRTDTGEQGIIWDRIYPELPDSLENVSYVFHFYTPYEFTHIAEESFDRNSLETHLREKIRYPYDRHRPVIVTEYGVNLRQEIAGNQRRRIEWFRTVHDLFDSCSISSTVFSYKHLVNPWTAPFDIFSMYLHFYQYDQYLRVMDDSLKFVDTQARKAAEATGLDTVLYNCFFDGTEFIPVSPVMNGALIREMTRYCSNGTGVSHPHLSKNPSVRQSTGKDISPLMINLQGKMLRLVPDNDLFYIRNRNDPSGCVIYRDQGTWHRAAAVK